jgi:two-component system LytT family response regulator
MLKIVIIDDEKNVRLVLKNILKLVSPEAEVIGEANSVKNGLKLLKELKPDLVLLDIKLGDGTGFSLLNKLEEIDFKLVFITAFNEYAIKAFKFNAFDYLLKPIDPVELKNTIQKVQEKLNTENELKLLLSNYQENQENNEQKLVIKTSNKTYFLPLNHLLYFQSDGSYCKIFTKDISILASKNLKHFQELLPKEQFIRTHQSYVVNKKHIVGIENNHVLFENDLEIPISVRKLHDIRKKLNL